MKEDAILKKFCKDVLQFLWGVLPWALRTNYRRYHFKSEYMGNHPHFVHFSTT
jgi:hypothetical protein